MTTYTVNDLVNEGSSAYIEMTKPGAPTTCYDLAVYSLTMTGELKKAVWEAWRGEIPKANTFYIVDPTKDQRIVDPKKLPPNSLIGFYRRFRPGEHSVCKPETDSNWVLYHMVRTTATDNSPMVLGGNNGDRDHTNPAWSSNDVEKMFDWTGKEEVSMFPSDTLPVPNSNGINGKSQFVAFVAPIATVVDRLNKAFPGLAVFG